MCMRPQRSMIRNTLYWQGFLHRLSCSLCQRLSSLCTEQQPHLTIHLTFQMGTCIYITIACILQKSFVTPPQQQNSPRFEVTATWWRSLPRLLTVGKWIFNEPSLLTCWMAHRDSQAVHNFLSRSNAKMRLARSLTGSGKYTR